MSQNNNGAFVRWQGRTIEQLGVVNNLLIGLATGLLAYETQLAFEVNANFSLCEKSWLISSVIFNFLSLIVGCYVAWNRLKSFRITAKIARKRETSDREGIDELRGKTKSLDSVTWFLISTQFIVFLLGISSLLIVTVMRYLQ